MIVKLDPSHNCHLPALSSAQTVPGFGGVPVPRPAGHSLLCLFSFLTRLTPPIPRTRGQCFFLEVGALSKRSWSSVSLYHFVWILSNVLLCQTPALCWIAYNHHISWSTLGGNGGELSGGSCKPIHILLSFLEEWSLKWMCAHLRICKIVHSGEGRKYTKYYLLYFWDRLLVCNPCWCWMCYLIQANLGLKVIFPPEHSTGWTTTLSHFYYYFLARLRNLGFWYLKPWMR